MNTEERLRKLERENRWMKRIVIGLVLICGCMILVAAAETQDVIKAKTLYILDDKGKTAIKLHAPNGDAGIVMWDANRGDRPQMTISCLPADKGGGTQIFMKNAKGNRAVNIIAQKRGNIHTW